MDEARVRCPFFRRTTPTSIICEGVIDLSTNQWRFGLAADRERQLEVFCCGRFEFCEIYRAVHGAKYDEEPGG